MSYSGSFDGLKPLKHAQKKAYNVAAALLFHQWNNSTILIKFHTIIPNFKIFFSTLV